MVNTLGNLYSEGNRIVPETISPTLGAHHRLQACAGTSGANVTKIPSAVTVASTSYACFLIVSWYNLVSLARLAQNCSIIIDNAISTPNGFNKLKLHRHRKINTLGTSPFGSLVLTLISTLRLLLSLTLLLEQLFVKTEELLVLFEDLIVGLVLRLLWVDEGISEHLAEGVVVLFWHFLFLLLIV